METKMIGPKTWYAWARDEMNAHSAAMKDGKPYRDGAVIDTMYYRLCKIGECSIRLESLDGHVAYEHTFYAPINDDFMLALKQDIEILPIQVVLGVPLEALPDDLVGYDYKIHGRNNAH